MKSEWNNRLSVLIVDDNKVFRAVLKNTLKEYPQIGEITPADDAEKMFIQIDENKLAPDLVFMNDSLPGISGFEAAKRLLNIFPSIKVIIVTLHDTLENRALAKESGAIACIMKKNLVEEVESILDLSGHQAN
ncbi:MAG: response regulator [Candidatus Marinimicrobia bacterium]|nr:response regulator [Candidatus Neomarinimicrobiota bacterium]